MISRVLSHVFVDVTLLSTASASASLGAGTNCPAPAAAFFFAVAGEGIDVAADVVAPDEAVDGVPGMRLVGVPDESGTLVPVVDDELNEEREDAADVATVVGLDDAAEVFVSPPPHAVSDMAARLRPARANVVFIWNP